MADDSKGGEFLAGFMRAASFATALSKVIGVLRRGPKSGLRLGGERRFGMADNSKGGEFLAGFILGGLVGAAIGLLLAPQPGEETRAQLMERGIELKARAEEKMLEDARRRVEELEAGQADRAEKKEEPLTKLEKEKGKKAKA